MGLDESRKEKLVPRYKPHEAKPAEEETNPIFNDQYLKHHNIAVLRWNNKKEQSRGDHNDG